MSPKTPTQRRIDAMLADVPALKRRVLEEARAENPGASSDDLEGAWDMAAELFGLDEDDDWDE